MNRRLAVTATGLVVIAGAAGGTAFSGAAFVDSSSTPQAASADRVQRWLGLEVPDAASCVTPASVAATGADETLAVGVGGADAATAAGRTVDCTFVLHARDPLPEGADHVTVALDAGTPGVVQAALATGLDGSAPAASVDLAAGERRAVRLTVQQGADDHATLRVIARAPGETTDFLSYAVGVDVCAAALASSCVTTSPSTDPSTTTPPAGDPTPTPTPDVPATPTPTPPATPTPTPTPPTGAPVTGTGTGTVAGACLSRRRFTIHLHRLPRGQHYVSATVRIDGRAVKVHRGKTAWTAVADLRARPPKTVRVVIHARTSKHRTLTDVRVYRTCLPASRSKTVGKPAR
jgi:cell division septation protein DedD